MILCSWLLFFFCLLFCFFIKTCLNLTEECEEVHLFLLLFTKINIKEWQWILVSRTHNRIWRCCIPHKRACGWFCRICHRRMTNSAKMRCEPFGVRKVFYFFFLFTIRATTSHCPITVLRPHQWLVRLRWISTLHFAMCFFFCLRSSKVLLPLLFLVLCCLRAIKLCAFFDLMSVSYVLYSFRFEIGMNAWNIAQLSFWKQLKSIYIADKQNS